MDQPHQIAFGACLLDLRRRELRLNGSLQAVERKVFDLIALLVDKRQRVITKRELQAALWPGQGVSDGAIARTVMRARKALGDGSLIKTVHGVGYRFVGERVPAGAPDPKPAVSAAFRLALLPVENRSGHAQLDWSELGVAAMAIQGLESDPRLSVASLPEVLAAVTPLADDALVAERVDAATRLLGLDGCVHAVLRSQGQVLWLDYQGHGERLAQVAGSLRGDDVAEFGPRLASEIRSGLAPGPAAVGGPVSQDPFINQAYARAAQMQALHLFRAAAKLLAVVIEFEPASLQARLAHVLALANLEDPTTHALADELASMAALRGDTRTQAKALIASGGALALAEEPGGLALAAHRLEQALQLAEPHAGEDWAVRIRLVYGWVSVLRGDLAFARELYASVEAATAEDNQFQRALTLDGRAALETECGERVKAHGLLERSAQIHLRHKLHSTAALTLMNLAHACVELGLLSRALEHARSSEALFSSVQQPHVAATIAEVAARVHGETRSLAAIDRVLRRLSVQDSTGGARPKAQWLVAQGLRAQCAGDHVQARERLSQALEMAEAAGSPVRRARRLQQLLELELDAEAEQPLAAARQRSLVLLESYKDAELAATLDRIDAARRLAEGDTRGALLPLRRMIDSLAPGRVQALARLDTAWLLADLDDRDAIPAVLRPIGPWLDEHPLGRALAQRLRARKPGPPVRRLPSLR